MKPTNVWPAKSHKEIKNNKKSMTMAIKVYARELDNTSSFGDVKSFIGKLASYARTIADKIDQGAGQFIVQESKVYKEYGFLSQKNSKLHSTLMENLKKDLKNKRG